MTTALEHELRREQEKLNRLVDEALKNGTPIAETFEIMKQSEKVNQLILKRETTEQHDVF